MTEKKEILATLKAFAEEVEREDKREVEEGGDPAAATESGAISADRSVALVTPPKEESIAPSSLGGASSPSPLPYADCDCLRCSYHWNARNPSSRPTACPRCGSNLWDRPPQRSSARRPSDPPNPNWQFRKRPEKRPCPTCGKPWRRKTVKELELERRQEAQKRKMVAEIKSQPTPIEPMIPKPQPVVMSAPRVVGSLTPPPALRSELLPPPPQRPHVHESPEVTIARRTLKEELEEKEK